MIVYICDPQYCTWELLHLISTFSNVAGYKINYQKKLGALLFTNDKWVQKKIRGTSSFIVAKNNIKYFGATLTKQVKDL